MANNQQLLLGEGAGSAPAVYIEDVFSTYLYTGTGSTQTITNNIDLSTKGGLVWFKQRNAANNHALFDTSRGTNKLLYSNTTSAQVDSVVSYSDNTLTAFNANGFTLGNDPNLQVVNTSPDTYASWTFRKQPKFFDVVTYTGTGSQQSINHNLGSVPGCIIVKRTDTTSSYWGVYHRSLTDGYALGLNTTDAQFNAPSYFVNSASQTSTQFTVGTSANVNASAGTYVAYLFAHDAGGFGLAGTDNVISCGSYTGAGGGYSGGSEINLGYEPQWVLIKSAGNATNWVMIDNMRGWEAGTSGLQNWLYANTSGAENTGGSLAYITSTGFKPYGSSLTNNTGTYIYIAIRRGPMKVPTVGTEVFSPLARTGTGATAQVSAGFPPDMALIKARGASYLSYWFDKLRGGNNYIASSSTAAEAGIAGNALSAFTQTGVTQGDFANTNGSGLTFVNWFFKRAPGFFDEVCYTGNGSTQTITHNLTVVPELIIAKNRGQAGNNWPVLFNFASTTMNYGFLNLTNSCPNDTYANVGVFSAAPTSTSMFLTNSGSMNGSGYGIVAYLFATVAGVSKIGTYTGNGSSQTIACGFTAGSRFVLIKRADSTGDWYVWDSARGIVAGNDPHLSLNTTAAEVTTDDSVDTDNSGFIVNQVAATNVNVTSATYIFLAIA